MRDFWSNNPWDEHDAYFDLVPRRDKITHPRQPHKPSYGIEAFVNALTDSSSFKSSGSTQPTSLDISNSSSQLTIKAEVDSLAISVTSISLTNLSKVEIE